MTFKIETPLGDFVPTVDAAMKINSSCGDFVEVLRKLALRDFNTYVAIASAALGKKPKDIESRVFQIGINDLCDPFTEFVSSLLNGGRDPKLRIPEDGDNQGE